MTENGRHFAGSERCDCAGLCESRAKALWHATDVLVEGEFSEEQIRVFGEVIARLTEEIEEASRAELSRRLAHSNNAPPKVVQMLAFDDSIEVAGPVLQFSPRLDVKSLIANIRSKGQPHLLAISQRHSVPIEVTDELVTRGNQEVVQSVAANGGARFSDFGFRQMIKRSETDAVLAERVGLRKEIPPHMFAQLIAKASDEVRRKLERERPELAAAIQASVSNAAGKLYSKFGPGQGSYLALKQTVTEAHKAGRLNQKSILTDALAHKFEEVVIGMSLLCALPLEVVEQMLTRQQPRHDPGAVEGARILVGDRDGAVVPRRRKSPYFVQRARRSESRVQAGRCQDVPRHPGSLSVALACGRADGGVAKLH